MKITDCGRSSTLPRMLLRTLRIKFGFCGSLDLTMMALTVAPCNCVVSKLAVTNPTFPGGIASSYEASVQRQPGLAL